MKIKKEYLKEHHMRKEAEAVVLKEGATIHIKGIPFKVLTATWVATDRGNLNLVGGIYLDGSKAKKVWI